MGIPTTSSFGFPSVSTGSWMEASRSGPSTTCCSISRSHNARRHFLGFLAAVCLVVMSSQETEACVTVPVCVFKEHLAKGGHLIVNGTIEWQAVGPALLERDMSDSATAMVDVPIWCNDYRVVHWWKNYACQNKDTLKLAVKYYDAGLWRLRPLFQWLLQYLPEQGTTLPNIGDSTGAIQNVHILVNLDEWLANPQPLLDEYVVVNGVCPNLPGYLIGVTPIVFDPLAGPGLDPFSTTPLTGTLYRDGEMRFMRIVEGPSLTQWGLIVLTLLLAILGAIQVAKRHRRVRAWPREE